MGGGVVRLPLRVDLHHIVSGVQLRDHAGGQHLPVVGLPGARSSGSASPDALRGKLFLDEQGEASLDSLLHADGAHEFVGVPDPGDRLAHVGHLPKLGRAALTEVKDAIVRPDEDRLHHGHAVEGVLLYPVADRGIPSVVFDATDHTVSFALWIHLGTVQFVHLEHLKLEREDAIAGVSLHEKDSAIHLFPADGHPQNLVQALGAGHVAVALFTPDLPERFNLFVQGFVVCFRLKHQTFTDHIANEWADHGIHQIAVALQITRSGADGVSFVAVGIFGTLVRRYPVRIDTAVIPGVVALGFFQCLTPRFPLECRLRAEPADHFINPSHGFTSRQKMRRRCL